MSCLVSYSESSDDEDSQISDLDQHSKNHNEPNLENGSNYPPSPIESSEDTFHHHIDTQQVHAKTVQDRVANTFSPATEDKSSALDLQSSRKRKLNDSGRQSLDLPSSIQRLYEDKCQAVVDNPALHQNRIRSFPHEVGNWATHVFILVPQNKQLLSFVDKLMELLMPQGFELLPEFHVSLSRTVVIRHHWIQPLVDSLREKLQHTSTSVCEIIDVKIFSNDEKTRSFVCLELSEDDTELLTYVKAVDDCFEDFRLLPYYENPSFHISIGWCLGDVTSSVPSERLSEAKIMLSEFLGTYPDLSFVYAHQIHCRTGNKSFVITLKESSCGG